MNVAWNSVWRGINFFDEVRWGTYKETKFQGKDVNGGKSWWGDMVEYNWYYTDYMWRGLLLSLKRKRTRT